MIWENDHGQANVLRKPFDYEQRAGGGKFFYGFDQALILIITYFYAVILNRITLYADFSVLSTTHVPKNTDYFHILSKDIFNISLTTHKHFKNNKKLEYKQQMMKTSETKINRRYLL